jgi:hypothetical protein
MALGGRGVTDAITNLRKLPPSCYGVLNGNVVAISRGAGEALAIQMQPGLVDFHNLRFGVTKAQRLAMEAGVVHGWTGSWTNPDTYTAKPMAMRPYRVWVPISYQTDVMAYSVEDAVEQVEHTLNLPEGYSLDGVLKAAAEPRQNFDVSNED